MGIGDFVYTAQPYVVTEISICTYEVHSGGKYLIMSRFKTEF